MAFLILPAGAVHPMTGAGQRSAMIFEAMRSVCPTTVVILGTARAGVEAFYPGAANVVIVPVDALASGGGRVAAASRTARRIMARLTDDPATPTVSDVLRDLMDAPGGAGGRIAVCRYYTAFAMSGLRDDAAEGVGVIVDMDDRDDRLIGMKLRGRMGREVGGAVARLTEPRMRRTIAHGLRRAGRIWLTKPSDRFEGAGLDERVIGNVPAAAPEADAVGPASDGRSVLFVGSVGYAPNRAAIRWFLEACWDRIRSRAPDATLRAVGLGDWSKIAARYGRMPGVEIVGPVASIAEEYARARVVVSPVHEGGGSQIKVIEACAFARPVVATRLSASGFGTRIQAGIDVADDAETFAARCVGYLRDGARATERGRALQRLQRRHLSRDAMVSRVARDVRDILDRPRAGAAASVDALHSAI